MSQVEIQKQRRRRQQRNGMKKTRTQWKDAWTMEEVEDYGTFREMFAKYGTKKFIYFCAQVPPGIDEDTGATVGYRLDGDEAAFAFIGANTDKSRTEWSLERYGRHKAWVSNMKRVDGKRVILVANAAGLLGILLVAEAADIIDEPAHHQLHRKGIPHRHLDSNLRHHSGEHHGTSWRTRKDGRRYRR
jgi:hypothetical protein